LKFTKEQAEGLARFIDTIASAAFIAATVGASGHSPLSTAEIVALFAVCPTPVSYTHLTLPTID
jgi:hypothetical protein